MSSCDKQFFAVNDHGSAEEISKMLGDYVERWVEGKDGETKAIDKNRPLRSPSEVMEELKKGSGLQYVLPSDGLPVLESAANDDAYDPSNIDVDPIHSYPMAHDLAQIKTDIVNTQDMIGEINQGTKEPFNHMDKAESTDFLQGRIDRLNDRFESNYEEARSDGTLDEVTSYVEQHGEFNAVQSTPLLAVQDTEPAANQSWDAPKALAM